MATKTPVHPFSRWDLEYIEQYFIAKVRLKTKTNNKIKIKTKF